MDKEFRQSKRIKYFKAAGVLIALVVTMWLSFLVTRYLNEGSLSPTNIFVVVFQSVVLMVIYVHWVYRLFTVKDVWSFFESVGKAINNADTVTSREDYENAIRRLSNTELIELYEALKREEFELQHNVDETQSSIDKKVLINVRITMAEKILAERNIASWIYKTDTSSNKVKSKVKEPVEFRTVLFYIVMAVYAVIYVIIPIIQRVM